MRRALILVSMCFSLAACQRSSDPVQQPDTDARVVGIADAFVDAYLERYPEQATYLGLAGRSHDRLTDNSLPALKAWQDMEDQWLLELTAVDVSTIRQPATRATLAILREALEGSSAARRCRVELWNVSQMQGWHVNLGYLVTIQPVGSDTARKEALARWGSLPAYVDAEIARLREGLEAGYTAPKGSVRIVLDQVRSLAKTPVASSPFASPASRDDNAGFKKAFDALVISQIVPAMNRYADFLEKEYLPSAREANAVSANPDGAGCYAASIRYWSSVAKTPEEVHQTGLDEMARLTAEMQEIGRRSFATTDVAVLMRRLRTERQFLFKSREELLGYSTAALARAKEAAPKYFGRLPKADVRLEPYPAFRERNAPNEYNPPSEDGSRPGLFYVSAYQAEQKSRADIESIAFHETIPGHHLQIALSLENTSIHPIGRYVGSSGFSEGWGLYSERLADEMGLYSSDLDRLGMLSAQALRASRLVVDAGLHALGWTREQAIDYMLKSSPQSRDAIAAEVDRYIIMPGQATAYMLGRLEIQAAREEAQKAKGAAFDIRAFHDRVLEDGGVPLAFLRQKIRTWASVSGS
jgi:uncharacterized protein (DUF885 family)